MGDRHLKFHESRDNLSNAACRRVLTERSVRTMGVVVLEVLLQHYGEVSRPGDQKLVEAFAPQCAYEAFRDRVRSWCPDGGADDADVGACERGVEGGGEFAVSVADWTVPDLVDTRS